MRRRLQLTYLAHLSRLRIVLALGVLSALSIALLCASDVARSQEAPPAEPNSSVYLPLIISAQRSAPSPSPTAGPQPTTAPTAAPIGDIKPDPNFRGPFCRKGADGDSVIIGFDETDTVKQPTEQEVIDYHLRAVNFIRRRTGLPALTYNTKLAEIAQQAQAANSGHGYFIKNCMNGKYGYGAMCAIVGEENGAGIRWKQENIGGAMGSRRSWQDGIRVPLCSMMEEDYGTGHRGNIEHKRYTHIGFSHKMSANGGFWFHEFGGPGDTRLDD
jgi:uncharacterized protein YkwD